MRDKDVRAAVKQRLHSQHPNSAETKIVEEMGIWSGSVRIDLAVINGELAGYELKSDKDNLDRLPLQAEIYSHVFDRMYLVVGERHAENAISEIPDWWGIISAHSHDKDHVRLYDIRESAYNPNLDPRIISKLLWKDEAISLIQEKLNVKGLKSKRVKELHEILANEIPLDDLRFSVRETLKARSGWLGQIASC